MPPTLILGKILANAVLATYVFTETLKWSCHSCSGQAMDPGPQGNSWNLGFREATGKI